MGRGIEPRRQPTRSDAVQTRARLLDAAGKAFAEHGLRQARVRDICNAAGVNLGAVTYYFGSKEAMYREVLLESHRRLVEAEPLPRLADAPDARTALRRWLDYFLRLVLVRRAAHPFIGRIVMHEMAHPTAALDDLTSRVMQPVRNELERIVRALSPRPLSPRRSRRITHFIVLLCVQHQIGRPILERFKDPPPDTEPKLDRLAEEIHAFALGGIARLSKTR
jgi:AcrR family transcriptional regulator